jgi:hypothetical protein
MPRYASYKGSFVYHASASGEPEYTGAKMLFSQASAPTGWTKITTYNDAGIRLTNSTVTPGGSGAFSTQLASRPITASGAMTISGASTNISGPTLPAHTHDPGWYTNPLFIIRPTWQLDASATPANRVIQGLAAPLQPTHLQLQPITSDQPHSHPNSYTVSYSSSVNMAVQYVDVIIAQKN